VSRPLPLPLGSTAQLWTLLKIDSVFTKTATFVYLHNVKFGAGERTEGIWDKNVIWPREATRCFVSLNISVSHSRSLKVIGPWHHSIDRTRVPIAFHSNSGPIWYNFRDKARFYLIIAILSYPTCTSTPPLGGPNRNIAIRFSTERCGYLIWENFDDVFSRFRRFDTIPACNSRRDEIDILRRHSPRYV